METNSISIMKQGRQRWCLSFRVRGQTACCMLPAKGRHTIRSATDSTQCCRSHLRGELVLKLNTQLLECVKALLARIAISALMPMEPLKGRQQAARK